MKNKTSRHDLQAVHLRTLLAQEGCPVCYELADSTSDYFFWFLHENYSDPGILKEVAAARGFCLNHGKFLAKSSANSHQLTYVFSQLTAELRRLLAKCGTSNVDRLRSGMTVSGLCPACNSLQGVADRSVFFLRKFLEDPENVACYGGPGRLCFPHFQAISGRLTAPLLRQLLNIHEGATVAALDSLDKVCFTEIDGGQNQDKEIPAGVQLSCHLAVGHFLGSLVLPSPQPGNTNGDALHDPVREFIRNLSRADSCAVCLEVHRAWQEWFAWLETAVQDGADVEDVLPACPQHVWAVVNLGSSLLAVSAIRNTLNASLRPIRHGIARLVGAPSTMRQSLLARLRNKIYGPYERLTEGREIVARPIFCPVCARLEVASDRALDLLIRLLEERRYRIAFENGYGLCMKHFSRALARASGGAIAGVLANVEGAKLARLGWELEETLRKEAWNTRPETKGMEQTAWRRAIDRYCGF